MSKGKSILCELNAEIISNEDWLTNKEAERCSDCSNISTLNSAAVDEKLNELKACVALYHLIILSITHHLYFITPDS